MPEKCRSGQVVFRRHRWSNWWRDMVTGKVQRWCLNDCGATEKRNKRPQKKSPRNARTRSY